MRLEKQWETYLGDFEAAEFDAARRLPFPTARPAVAGSGRAAARPRLEEMPDEGLAAGATVGSGSAGILALDRDAEAAAPAGHRAPGAGRRERLYDRLDDLLAAVVGRQRNRRAGIGPDDRAGLRHDVERAKRAVVFRRMRIDQVRQRDDDRGIHVGVGRVYEARDLRVRVGQVDLQIAAGFCNRCADVDVLVAAPVIVEPRLAEIDAV